MSQKITGKKRLHPDWFPDGMPTMKRLRMDYDLLLSQHNLRSLNKLHFEPAIYSREISTIEAKFISKIILQYESCLTPSIPTVFYIWKKDNHYDRWYHAFKCRFSLFHGSLNCGVFTPQDMQYWINKLAIYNIFGLTGTAVTLKSPIMLTSINNRIDQIFDEFMKSRTSALKWNYKSFTSTLLITLFIVCEYFVDYEDKSWDVLNSLNISNDAKGIIFDYAFHDMQWFKDNNIIHRNKLIFIVFVFNDVLNHSWFDWLCQNMYLTKNDKKTIYGYIKAHDRKKTCRIDRNILKIFK